MAPLSVLCCNSRPYIGEQQKPAYQPEACGVNVQWRKIVYYRESLWRGVANV
jgi:hypothetical protein